MRVVSNLANEFDEICAEYSRVDQQGQDIVTLVKMFGAEYNDFNDETEWLDFKMAWQKFLGEHQHQVTVPMVGQIVYLLVTYWQQGHRLFQSFPVLEKVLARDTVQEISDEIQRRSAANGDSILAAEE